MELIPLNPIAQRILLIRGHRVMLDSDLADLYEVSTKRLNEQVRRNIKRFPPDFMFQLTPEEFTSLRSQNATLKIGRGQHRKYLPYAFTEQGVAMLSGVLNSECAIDVNVAIMRAFVKLREFAMTHKELSRKLNAMEKKYDAQFKVVFDAIRQLMTPPEPKRRKIENASPLPMEESNKNSSGDVKMATSGRQLLTVF
ncbi:MAG: ORF6N domain-containing protein [Nitrospinae bacterium]|nr:ORF6N domain-containing protein [Nitrospinota bacterium]